MAEQFAAAFYASKEWRDLRQLLIIQRGGKCERTGKVFVDTSKLIGHHKIALTPENINDANISLNPDNIEIISLDVHNQEHKRFGYAQQVYIVWGSPLSGKNTFVNEVSSYGDLTIDIDSLWQAVSNQPRYSKPNSLRFNVFALRDNLYDQVRTRHGQWQDAYIISGFASRLEREDLARRLGATEIYIESTRQECIDRLGDRPREWVDYINKWHDEHERYG